MMPAVLGEHIITRPLPGRSGKPCPSCGRARHRCICAASPAETLTSLGHRHHNTAVCLAKNSSSRTLNAIDLAERFRLNFQWIRALLRHSGRQLGTSSIVSDESRVLRFAISAMLPTEATWGKLNKSLKEEVVRSSSQVTESWPEQTEYKDSQTRVVRECPCILVCCWQSMRTRRQQSLRRLPKVSHSVYTLLDGSSKGQSIPVTDLDETGTVTNPLICMRKMTSIWISVSMAP